MSNVILNDFIPAYDFRERHSIVVTADADACQDAARTWRPRDSRLWRWLLRMRGLGEADGTLRDWAASNGFLLLGETEDEVAYGQIGRFWALNERGALMSPKSVEEFRAFDRPGYAVAVMNVRVRPLEGGRTRISTETRILALGSGARLRFRLYWLVIRPFSGLLRRAMLSGMAERARRAASREELEVTV